MNTTAHFSLARGGRVASPGMISLWALAPSVATFLRRTATASGSRSIKTASAAPRDNASSPSAPVPAKASSTALPVNGMPSLASCPCERMLKSASRARSLVGRTVSPTGASRRRPRYLPPTIRMSRPSELLGQHLLWYLGDLTTCQIAELERPKREPDQPGHREAEMFEHTTHFTVLALTQSQRDPRVAALQALE